MKWLEMLIDKVNYHKAVKLYLLFSCIIMVLCLGAVGYTLRDKIYMAVDYKGLSETFEKSSTGDKLTTQANKLASDSKDIVNVIVLDSKNNITFKINNDLVDNRTNFQLIPFEFNRRYLQDETNKNTIFKVVRDENIIINKDYIRDYRKEESDIDDNFSFERDFFSKNIYLLNYMVNRATGNKILIFRTVNPIPHAEQLLKVTIALFGFLFMLYWIGLALWVYKDSENREMNAPLWGLLTLITNLVGLIVYLIYKQNNQRCYKCGVLQNKMNIFCSHCGVRINDSCGNCGNVVSKQDFYCSRCGQKLEK